MATTTTTKDVVVRFVTLEDLSRTTISDLGSRPTFLFFYGAWDRPPAINVLTRGLRRSVARTIAATAADDDDDEKIVLRVVRVDGSEEEGVFSRCPATLPSLAVVLDDDDDDDDDDGGPRTRSTGLDPRRSLSRTRPRTSKEEEEDATAVSEAVDALLSGREATTTTSRRDETEKEKSSHTVASANEKTSSSTSPSNGHDDRCLRLFVSGDRSQVGKSSACLGLLAALLERGYEPSELAYVKPATQCEAPQLVASFCERRGVEAVPVGPIVYYSGFTRRFLEGGTASSEELLAGARDVVDRLCRRPGRRVVIVDGVGYPAVGSICGTCNASVARAVGRPRNDDDDCRSPVPVLLVGKRGVGDAVDSYNLNASYFRSRGVPVIGAVFNRLSTDEEGDYYSLRKCRDAVTTWFDRFGRNGERAFGFVPETSSLAEERYEEFVEAFRNAVDVDGIIEAARCATTKTTMIEPTPKTTTATAEPFSSSATREQIEAAARGAGAAAG